VLVLILFLFLASQLTMQSILETLPIWVSTHMVPKSLGTSPNSILHLMLRKIIVSNLWFTMEIKLVLVVMSDRLVSDLLLLALLDTLDQIVKHVISILPLAMHGHGIVSQLEIPTLLTI
jgi:hypothetical protein